jgi:hypothetical protein
VRLPRHREQSQSVQSSSGVASSASTFPFRGSHFISHTILSYRAHRQAMPSHPPTRLTKKQRKATAFRERGIKSKGTGKQNPAPTPGRPRLGRRRHSPSTGDNGEDHDDHHEDEDEDDEDANAVPAMEDQDQAMAEMDSAAAQKKKKDEDKDKDKDKRSRASDKDSEAPPASKKARLSRGSDKIPPPLAREEDEDKIGATRMNVLKDGESGEHESERKDKGSKQRRYILFIGMSLPSPSSFPQPTASFAITRSFVEGNLKYTTTREAIQDHFSQCGAFSPRLTGTVPLTHDPHFPHKRTRVLPAHDRSASDCAPTHSQAHPSWCRADQVQRLRVPRVLGAVSAAGCPPHAPV